MMRALVVLCLSLSFSTANAVQSAGVTATPVELLCKRCTEIVDEIRQVLLERCDSAPEIAHLRKQPLYLFLSIFDEVSQGGDQVMAKQIYSAAIEGMECDNPDAGVQAAQKMANQLMTANKI